MGKRRHPSTDKVARPLEWRVEEHSMLAALNEGPVVEPVVADAPTVPLTTSSLPRVALRIPSAQPRIATASPVLRIAGTPSPASRIAGTPSPPRLGTRGSSPQLGARGSTPLITNPLGQPIFAPPLSNLAQPSTRGPVVAPAAVEAPTRRARDSLARFAYFFAGAGVAVGLVAYGHQLWNLRQAPDAPATASGAHAAPSTPAATLALPDGRLELSADRRAVTRFTGDAPAWTVAQPAALASLELTGPIALGHTDFTASADQTIVAIDLATGRARFSWTPPADEHWGTQAPLVLGSCLLAPTARARRNQLRCLDLATGDLRWTAPLASGCAQLPTAVSGAFVVPCSGATAIIDEQTGAMSLCRQAGGGCSVSRPAHR